MKHENVNYLLVGSFVLAMLAALLVVLALITGRAGDTDSYHAFYENVSGVKFGTLVNYEGYHIGQVEKISPIHSADGTRYRVDFSVQQGWRIPVDSVARLAASGLLSTISIDIREGHSSSLHTPGAEVASEGGADLFAGLAEAASSIQALTADDIRPLIADLSARLRNLAEKAEQRVPRILAEWEGLSTKLNHSADEIPQILAEVRATAGRLSESAEEIRRVVTPENRQGISEMISTLNQVSVRLDALLDESNALLAANKDQVSDSVAELRRAVKVVNEHIDGVAYNLEGASRNLNEFSRQIRDNPGTLLRNTPPVDETPVAQQ